MLAGGIEEVATTGNWAELGLVDQAVAWSNDADAKDRLPLSKREEMERIRERLGYDAAAWRMILSGYGVTHARELADWQMGHLLDLLRARVRLNETERLPLEWHRGDATRE